MAVIVYSTGCPKCKVLEKKLDAKNINYEILDDIDIIQSKGYISMPRLEVGNKNFPFKDAVWLVNRFEGGDFESFVESIPSIDAEK